MKDIIEYGADPSGVSDTAPAVMASIADQGYVQFPVKVSGLGARPRFRFTTPVDVNEPCVIEGPGSTRIGAAPAACDLFTTDTHLDVFRINSDHVTMRGINLLGTGARTQNGMGRAIVVGPGDPVQNVRILDCSVFSHFIGIHNVNASNFWYGRNTLHGRYSLMLENRSNSDKGDGTVRSNEFFADGLEGSRNVFWKSGGSPKFEGNKYLLAQDAFVLQVTEALTGGPMLNDEHFEGYTRYAFYAYGNGTAELHGLSVNDSWMNGGQGLIKIADNARINNFQISGVNGTSGNTNPLIDIGAGVKELSILPNTLDGQGSGTGILIRPGAAGIVHKQSIMNCPAPISNQSAGVTVL